MSLNRFNAIDTILNRSELDLGYVDAPSQHIAEFFGANVFGDAAMQQYLDEATYLNVKKAVQNGEKLTRETAAAVAAGMQKWAMEKGATHFTHWFQPLTGRTAEKHDSFFNLTPDGKVIEEFTADSLLQQEPDGSSFPSGGMRSTFEARGYTGWDPTSPAFLFEVGEGKTLCIPTIFITYSGESTDYKLPLLRSIEFVNDAAVPVCQLFDENVTKVTGTLGWEQEYFVIDEALYNLRPDLQQCGRTLVGKTATKGQQLEDFYFGSIPERVYAFMRDVEVEAHKLGIPVRTRHNEVGPAQYEVAPVFEEINVAVDHNTLLMDLMERVARRHKLACLLHEKPFAGVNGSGKHNNWSLATNTGKNLLSPGKEPGKNLQFLTFFVTTIRAVYEHADLLRSTVATANNDHRLGANEAPPAIISCFLGATLDQLLNDIEAQGSSDASGVKGVLNLVSKLPDLEKDSTDRNRTSPFAFTGNKFEIRAVGSSQNCGGPMTVMNSIVGAQLLDFKKRVDVLIESGKAKEEAILAIIIEYIKESKAIRFEGNGYSNEWKEEAAKRGLGNYANTPAALKAMVSEKTIALYTGAGIFTEKEIHAHYEVNVHAYVTRLNIESRTLGELSVNLILPAALSYQTRVAQNIASLKAVGLEGEAVSAQMELLVALNDNINGLATAVKSMTLARREAAELEGDACAEAYCSNVKSLMETARTHADRLEYLVEDGLWPLPKYREMFYMK